MTPKVKIFENVFPDFSTGCRTTFRHQIWWKSAVAKLLIGRVDYHTKKLWLCGIRPCPHFAQNGPIAPKIPERCQPLTCPCIPNLVRIGCVLPDLFRKDWFFVTKSQYNIGFQATTIPRQCLWCCHHGRAIARVHPVHLMNVQWRQAADDPQTEPNNMSCESACRLPESTPTIAIYYYYSAQKMIVILTSHRG